MNSLALDTLAGGDSAGFIGRPIEKIFHADDREAAMAQLAGADAPFLERRMLRHDGTQLSVELNAQSVLFDGDQAVVVTARDISEQKKAQGQLMVSERMASVGMLAAGVAHEINNPLANVLANLDFVRVEVKPFSDHSPAFIELERALAEARESGERVKQIVLDLKLFTRSEAKEHREPVDVHRVLEMSLRMASNEIRHRATLVKDFGDIPPVLANDARLGQVFLNLLVNAAQAIPEGRADKNEIRIVTRVTDDRVLIEVTDTGPGMPPETLKKLFTPFFTTKPVGVGTGLGLSICHRLISGMGGEIQIESQVGKGSTFRILLEATTVEAIRPPPSAPLPMSTGRRGRVLVIDDEPMVANAIERTLMCEHDVTVVNAAEDGLAQILSEPFDVILCDLMMPAMTGMEFYAHLIERAPDQADRIIFLSGGTFTAAASNFLELVPNPRLDKPFDVRQLRRTINAQMLALAPVKVSWPC